MQGFKRRFNVFLDILIDVKKGFITKQFLNLYQSGKEEKALNFAQKYYHNIVINDYSLMFFLISEKNKTFLEKLLKSRKEDQKSKMFNDNSNQNQFYPITFSVLNRIDEMTQFLLQNGADINVKHEQRNSLAHIAAFFNKIDALEYCLEKQLNINEQNDLGNTPLHLAAMKSNNEILEFLLKRGAKDDIPNEKLFYPIHEAVLFSNIDGLKLLEPGLEKIRSKEQACDIVHLAAQLDTQDILRYLLEKKKILANKHDNDKYHAYPLHYATGSKQVDNVKFLIENGALVNAQDKFKNTPLHLAIQYKYLEIARLLAEAGADASIKNDEGLTPIDIAIAERDQTMISYLKSVTRYIKHFQ